MSIFPNCGAVILPSLDIERGPFTGAHGSRGLDEGRFQQRPLETGSGFSRTSREGVPEFDDYGSAWGDYGPFGTTFPTNEQLGESYRPPAEGRGVERDRSQIAEARQRRGPFYGKGPSGYRRSDQSIIEEVIDRLTEHPHVDATDIAVECTEGFVTLRGHVDDLEMKQWAEEAVSEVRGVIDVDNLVRVRQLLRPA